MGPKQDALAMAAMAEVMVRNFIEAGWLWQG